MSKLEDAIFKLCEDDVNTLGFELVEVNYALEQGDYVLTFFIHSEKGITLEDCEKVSNVLNELLDREDPIENKYILSVSSLGLDRPIKTEGDFKRNIGNKIHIKLYTPKFGKKEHIGILVKFDTESFTILDSKEEQLTFEKKEVAKIVLEIEF